MLAWRPDHDQTLVADVGEERAKGILAYDLTYYFDLRVAGRADPKFSPAPNVVVDRSPPRTMCAR